MKKVLFATSFTFLFSSCGGPPTVKDFLDDPELLSQTTKTCLEQMLKKEKELDEETCANAKEAQIQKAQNAIDSVFE